MAANPIPESYPSFIVQFTEAFNGAENIGAGIPLLVNTGAAIGADRLALFIAQGEFRAARSGIVPLSAARKAAVKAAYDFCFTARDVLMFYLGREFNEAWVAAGFVGSLEIPQSYDGLYDLALALETYFTGHAAQEAPTLNVTAARAAQLAAAMNTANTAVINAEALGGTKKDVRDEALTAARKRLSDLCKELSMRLGPLDQRWRQFGFNMPGAATVPAVPVNVVVTDLSGARLQIACDASPNATRYRFYTQRPILDPEPLLAGSATEPLFVTEPLVAGQVYQIYVSAINEGAESELSEPVNATPVLAAAA
jgi:hypothetical protein